MMKKLIERLLLFIISIPCIVLIVLFLPQRNHLAINCFTTIFSALGAVEFRYILGGRNSPLSRIEAAVLGCICPAAMTLIVSFDVGFHILSAVFVVGASWLLVSRVFSGGEKLKNFTPFITAGFSVMLYPGLFLAWFIRMNLFAHAEVVMLTFLLTVFANDSAAWAAGMLFGQGNRKIVPASPNKSIAGYVGGTLVSVIVGTAVVFIIPQAFQSSRLPPALAGLILGLLSGTAASLGDLAESAMKRSSDIKDSGSIIPGRGGVLDSIDSIALSAPVFYALYKFFFQ
jgi:phosphatidate cytidylyltransferase